LQNGGPTLGPPAADWQTGKNSLPQTPFLFARLLGVYSEIFWGGIPKAAGGWD
tara:strand:+ start:21062 stop:21220 length:159 start_codon:yes stop_codon:yes gene_type:complete